MAAKSESLPLLQTAQTSQPSPTPQRVGHGTVAAFGFIGFAVSCGIGIKTIIDGRSGNLDIAKLVQAAIGALASGGCTCYACFQLISSLRSPKVETATASMNSAAEKAHQEAFQRIHQRLQRILTPHSQLSDNVVPINESADFFELIDQDISQLNDKLSSPAECESCGEYQREIESIQAELEELKNQIVPAPSDSEEPTSPLQLDTGDLRGKLDALKRRLARRSPSSNASSVRSTPAITPEPSPYKSPAPPPEAKPKQVKFELDKKDDSPV